MSKVKLIRSTPQQQQEARRIIQIPNHPVLYDAITMLRKTTTNNERFRQYTDRAADFLMIEATRDLPLTSKRIETPLGHTTQSVLKSDVVRFVAILRAGLALWPRRFLPKSRMSTIGIVRDEETAKPHLYQQKLDPAISGKKIILLDPMLATGGSACAALALLVQKGVEPADVTFVCVIAAVAGVLFLHQEYPSVKIIGAALDNHLTTSYYIYPGLGDFGCRYFGTD